MPAATLRVRWLGTVPYREAWALQRGLHDRAVERTAAGGVPDDHLLLLEHPPTITAGRHADPDHVLVDPRRAGFDLVDVDRGGDVTYHGPGQLVAYPLVALPGKGGGSLPDTPAWVCLLEQVLIDVVRSAGVASVGRLPGFPGVWVEPDGPHPRKIAAVGVRIAGGRTMHGVALNVEPDLEHFRAIVPCGISEHGVTSLAAEGVAVDRRSVVDAFVERFVEVWSPVAWERADVVWRPALNDADLAEFSRTGGEGRSGDGSTSVRLVGRLARAGVSGGVDLRERKPEWMRAPVRHDRSVLATRRTVDGLGLVTVCEEAGCPNLSECWSEGTATFMVCGERCTRACGFCLVDTRHPEPLDATEPERVAEAVARMELDHVVVTMVARDDLDDGGADHVARTVRSVRDRSPGCTVEVLISDLHGDEASLDRVLAARPEVVNHNVETVPRLQRAVRPSAGYARSLAVLARSAASGAVTKSGLVVGMGEELEEIHATLADLAAVGVDIVTIGQYLRPTARHLPVARWWTPEEFEGFAQAGRELGLAHVESSPFTRSSHHAAESYRAALPRVAERRGSISWA